MPCIYTYVYIYICIYIYIYIYIYIVNQIQSIHVYICIHTLKKCLLDAVANKPFQKPFTAQALLHDVLQLVLHARDVVDILRPR